MMKTCVLLLLVLVAACTDNHELTACRGAFQPANPGKWTPTPEQLSEVKP